MPWVQIALAFLTDGPEMLSEAKEVFHSVAHGEGGVDKITKVVSSLEHLLTHAVDALGKVSK